MQMGTKNRISADRFSELVRTMTGLRVSHPWRGYGSAIFLELGKLRRVPLTTREGFSLKGRCTVMIEWSWRVERQRSVAFGSWSGDEKISNGLKRLERLVVENVALEGRLPELNITLSGRRWVRSFTTVEGQPEWTLFLPDDSWIHVERGVLIHKLPG